MAIMPGRAPGQDNRDDPTGIDLHKVPHWFSGTSIASIEHRDKVLVNQPPALTRKSGLQTRKRAVGLQESLRQSAGLLESVSEARNPAFVGNFVENGQKPHGSTKCSTKACDKVG